MNLENVMLVQHCWFWRCSNEIPERLNDLLKGIKLINGLVFWGRLKGPPWILSVLLPVLVHPPSLSNASSSRRGSSFYCSVRFSSFPEPASLSRCGPSQTPPGQHSLLGGLVWLLQASRFWQPNLLPTRPRPQSGRLFLTLHTAVIFQCSANQSVTYTQC